MSGGVAAFFASQGYAVVVQTFAGGSPRRVASSPSTMTAGARPGTATTRSNGSPPSPGATATLDHRRLYAGATQYRLAPTRPPHLRAMYVRESSADYWAEWVYHGALSSWRSCSMDCQVDVQQPGSPDGGTPRSARGGRASWNRPSPSCRAGTGSSRSIPIPWSRASTTGSTTSWRIPRDGPFWWQWNIEHRHADVDVPIVHQGGWFDIFLAGTLKNFVGLRARARTQAARDAQRLVVGPWVHGPWNMAKTVQGEVDFGAEALWEYNARRLPWFDHWLRGARNTVAEEPRVRLFVMGENRWREADDYPLAGVRPTAVAPPRRRGAHPLEPRAPAERANGSHRADPDDPVPTLGGATLNIPGGAYDQRPIEDRCLTYTSAPLERDLTVIGEVRCVLHAMSSAPDTDFVVRLTDVHPDGFSRLLCDGVLRARYRDSVTAPAPLTPHRVYELTVDLWATANTFRRGHRIRGAAVASSSFPRFDRNLHTGGPVGTGARGQVALNTVFHDALRPSRIVLPVVDHGSGH